MCTTATGPRRWWRPIPTVRYVSLHQYPWYPGTGAADERGVGNVFNVPRGPGQAALALRGRSVGGHRGGDDRLDARSRADVRRLRCHGRRSARRLHPRAGALSPTGPPGCGDRLPAVPIVGMLEGGYVPDAPGRWRVGPPPRAGLIGLLPLPLRAPYNPAGSPRSQSLSFEDALPHPLRMDVELLQLQHQASVHHRARRPERLPHRLGPADRRRWPGGLGRGGAEQVLRRDGRIGAGRARGCTARRCPTIRSTWKRRSGAGKRCCVATPRRAPRFPRRCTTWPASGSAFRSTGCGDSIPARRRNPPSPSGSIHRSGSGPRCSRRSSIRSSR